MYVKYKKTMKTLFSIMSYLQIALISGVGKKWYLLEILKNIR